MNENDKSIQAMFKQTSSAHLIINILNTTRTWINNTLINTSAEQTRHNSDKRAQGENMQPCLKTYQKEKKWRR